MEIKFRTPHAIDAMISTQLDTLHAAFAELLHKLDRSSIAFRSLQARRVDGLVARNRFTVTAHRRAAVQVDCTLLVSIQTVWLGDVRAFSLLGQDAQ